MIPAEIRAVDIALFARLILDEADYPALSDAERMGCESALAAAKAAVEGYTGLSMQDCQLEDISYAIKTMAAEMVDNHQITSQSGTMNPTVLQILNMHSTNLLPSVEEE